MISTAHVISDSLQSSPIDSSARWVRWMGRVESSYAIKNSLSREI